MKRQFIPDKEKSLCSENDYLKTGVYADTLEKIIKNTPNKEVFTIGLFGNWGTGKSSIIETTKSKFEQSQSKVKFITYDAWKYANDSFRRMFLLKIQDDLRLEQTSAMERFYQSENAEVKPRQVFTLRGLKIVVWLAIVTAIIVAVLPSTWMDWSIKTPIISIVPLLTLLVTVFNGFFHNLKISVSKPALFAPEQFEACFKQMMEVSLKKENCVVRAYKKAIEFIKRGATSVTNLDKIVIVIDNIDRCHNAMAYQLLTDIKTFLGDEEYNVVFIIPVDNEALKQHLSTKEGDEFLRKFFNVTLRIKPHQPTEMLSFTHELNKNNSLGLNNDTLSLVAKEFATNPRRIIQLLNNLSSELALYETDFAIRNEAQICAILIIREEFPSFYTQILDNVNLLKSRDEKEINDDNKVSSFMKIAEVLFLETETSDILKILTNTSCHFDIFPADLRKAVGVDASIIVEYINNNKEQESIVGGFILDSLGIDTKYASTANLANWLDFLAQLHAEQPIEKTQLKLLNDRHNKHYEAIMSSVKNTTEICSYANALEMAGCCQLKYSIISYISATYDVNKEPHNYHDFVDSVFHLFNNAKDSKILGSFAENYHSGYHITPTEIEYTDDQKRHLFTDKLIVNIIKEIKKVGSGEWNADLLWLFENKPNVSKETYSAFFTQIDSLLGASMNNKAKEDLLSCIEFLIPFMAAIPSQRLSKELAIIYGKLFNPRSLTTAQQRSGYYQNQSTTTVNLLDEYKGDACALETMSLFCCEIYRITGNETDIGAQMKVLYPLNTDVINARLISLLEKKFSLAPLFDVILGDDSLSPENLQLTEHCLMHRQKDKSRTISATALKNKISNLVANVANDQVSALLIKLNNIDEEIKGMVIEEIVGKDNVFINSLPQQLLDLAVGAFNKDNYTTYITNYPYLESVAEKGTAPQKSLLANKLYSNVENRKDVDATLGVFEKLALGNKNDRSIVVAHFEKHLETPANVTPEQRTRIEALVQKYSGK